MARELTIFDRVRAGLAVGACGLSLLAAERMSAQDDPFGGAAAGAAKPAVAAPAARPARDEAKERDPAVLSILDSAPATPEALARAARNLTDLGRPALARRYLDALEKTNPTPAVWAELHGRFGTDFFLRLARDPDLQPEGARIGRTALEASQALASDPARIAQVIAQLGSDDAAQRRQARLALRQVGGPAVGPLVAVLADESRTALHGRIQAVLVEMGELAVEPLVGALESDDVGLRTRAATVLGHIPSRRALGYLVRLPWDSTEPDALRAAARDSLLQLVEAAPDKLDAEHYLRRRVTELLAGSTPLRLDAENRAQLWHWDAASRTVVPRSYVHRELCSVEAARLARELYRLEGENVEHRRLYLAADLESAKLLAGLHRPLPTGEGSAVARAEALGVAVVEDLLADMLRQKRVLAAAAAAEVLGEIGDATLVEARDGTPRPLVLAVNQADRRLRFAALNAIVKLNPTEPFAGSNYVTETLGYLAGSVGSRRVLVAHPKLEEAQSLVGVLAELGYEGDVATTGRSAFLLATKQPDYEFVLISDLLSGPPARELLPQLRHDRRTAGLLVGILVQLAMPVEGTPVEPDNDLAVPDAVTQRESRDADLSIESRAKSTLNLQALEVRRGSTYYDRTPSPVNPLIKVRQWTTGDELTAAFGRPYDRDGMAYVVQQLRLAAGPRVVTRDERLAQAETALNALAMLAQFDARYSFYEVLRLQNAVELAARTPELAAAATRALGQLGTPKAQVALVDLASQHGRSIEDRRAAAEAFHVAVQRRSLLLTKPEILRQYERYNRSENLDRDTQTVLGDLLDTIERRGAADSTSGDSTDTAEPAASAAPTPDPSP